MGDREGAVLEGEGNSGEGAVQRLRMEVAGSTGYSEKFHLYTRNNYASSQGSCNNETG
jgi:hypothetical protein